MSTFAYYCIELNAHALVNILVYLKEKKMTHLFLPFLMSSQPCESFYRQIRSLSTVNSTVTNCSIKEILSRINRIDILNGISNDKNTGFVFPKTLKSIDSLPHVKFKETEFPTRPEIFKIMQDCKLRAVDTAKRLGMIKKGQRVDDSMFSCQVPPYTFLKKKK